MKSFYFLLALSIFFANIICSQNFPENSEPYRYIKNEFNFNKKYHIKTIKRDYQIEYYNQDGSLNKIEYFDKYDDNTPHSIFSIVYFIYKDEKMLFCEINENFSIKDNPNDTAQYDEIGIHNFIIKKFHYYESPESHDYLIFDGKIWAEYSDWDFGYDLYIYNNDVLSEILTFDSKSNSFSLDSINIHNINETLEYLKNNPQFKLVSQEKYNYDLNNKFISVEFVDFKNNKTKINYVEYNSKGLVSKNEYGQTIDYEYYY